MDRRVFTAILLSFAVVGLIALAVVVFQPFLLAMLWAAVFATVTYGAYLRLTDWLNGRRSIAAALMTVAVLLLIMGPFVAISLHLVDDLVQFFDRENLEGAVADIRDHGLVRSGVAKYEEWTGEKLDLIQAVKRLEPRDFLPLADAARNVLGFLGALLATLAFIALSIYYFYRDGPALVEVMHGLLPLPDEDRKEVFRDLHGAVVAAVRGGLLVAVAQGLLGFLILWILGVGRPVLWASSMALASFVPLVGTAIVWAPIAGFLLLRGETGSAIALVAYGVVVIGMADNLLRPLLVGQSMEAHPLPLFFGILGGIAAFGFVGIIMGPIVVALLTAAQRIFRREFGKEGG